jgi:hypothetical protein
MEPSQIVDMAAVRLSSQIDIILERSRLDIRLSDRGGRIALISSLTPVGNHYSQGGERRGGREGDDRLVVDCVSVERKSKFFVEKAATQGESC